MQVARPLLTLLLMLTVVSSAFADECSPGDCAAEAAFPEPNVIQLIPDTNKLWDRDYYRVVEDVAVQFYDAPGGTVIGSWKAGDNFVTIYEVQGEWGRTGENQWVHMSQVNKQNVVVSNFTGLLLPEDEPQPYPIAWSIVNQWGALEPGLNPSESSTFFYRYSYNYIYDTVVDENGHNWYQLGEDAWVHQFRVSVHAPIEMPEDVSTERWVAIDLYEQVLTAYEGEIPVFTTLVSTGLPWWATNLGLFNVTLMNPREDMTQDLPDDFYYIQEVPWTAFFDRGIALHGTFWHDGFGYPQSHGCVNMSITDAHWLYRFIEPEFSWTGDNPGGASVYVYTTDPALDVE
jgi:hypothetical protein